MAISGHRSEASLTNYIGHPSSEQLRACSDILSDELSRRPHQSHQPSLEQFVFYWSCEKKLVYFYER
ncbi:hypothetical protein pdam_00025287 [Pocillopora damicornis]|uniref:Uncharacterized protein n=1 Tax=Pocillopora damicornis TaxID=46731 RepID=A0A3M6USW7_POCDA|nr:hypothetical protein pdam_00025287 [Pocillopora damicornis]